ncbi:MAG: hypothetical protein Pg6A_20110 [Termitinemataceae bacterium]|nr:MAG: hypothetical protein Pg6A_20110 [Termitinemataceae bacterium]
MAIPLIIPLILAGAGAGVGAAGAITSAVGKHSKKAGVDTRTEGLKKQLEGKQRYAETLKGTIGAENIGSSSSLAALRHAMEGQQSAVEGEGVMTKGDITADVGSSISDIGGHVAQAGRDLMGLNRFEWMMKNSAMENSAMENPATRMKAWGPKEFAAYETIKAMHNGSIPADTNKFVLENIDLFTGIGGENSVKVLDLIAQKNRLHGIVYRGHELTPGAQKKLEKINLALEAMGFV